MRLPEAVVVRRVEGGAEEQLRIWQSFLEVPPSMQSVGSSKEGGDGHLNTSDDLELGELPRVRRYFGPERHHRQQAL